MGALWGVVLLLFLGRVGGALASSGEVPELDVLEARVRVVSRRVAELERKALARRRARARQATTRTPSPTAGATPSATVFSEAGCRGTHVAFDLDRSEKLCKSCFDSCQAKFEDGSRVHEGGRSRVRSMQVSGGGVARIYSGCHGTYSYNSKDFLEVVTEGDGCFELQSLDFVELYASEARHRSLFGSLYILENVSVPSSLPRVDWEPPRDRSSVRGSSSCGRETAYWHTVPADLNEFSSSPFPQGGYLSFEPDWGGWNNVRLGVEIAVLLAAATGRTLVLPPMNKIYLLSQSGRDKLKAVESFYDLETLAAAGGPPVVTAEEFAEKQGAGVNSAEELYQWMRRKSDLSLEWVPDKHALVFPTANDAPPLDRTGLGPVRQAVGQRRGVDVRALAPHNWVHMPVHGWESRRYLSQFYGFLLFMNATHERRYWRLARDGLRYSDRIQCAAGAVVRRLREEGGGSFVSAHIRRGEFQQKPAWLGASQIVANTRDVLPAHRLLYVSTDEKKREWFAPFGIERVRLFSDFKDLPEIQGLRSAEIGMVEQLIASQGDVFIGTWWSTFTALIMRIRGYLGKGSSQYFAMLDYKNEMVNSAPRARPSRTGWWREWPVAWTGIDEF
eukprot:Hpha_TRINITY_DN19424_c0_g1::TRINITY_DN19424_c0_g1_i1::g.45711::m.45711